MPERAEAFSAVTGGRPSSFHGVTEWGTRWPRAKARGTARGEGHKQAGRLAAPGGLGTKEKALAQSGIAPIVKTLARYQTLTSFS